MRAARLVIRFRLHQPTAEIYIDGRQNPVRAAFGPRDTRPDLDIELAADTLHRILLGELTLTKALSSGQMKVKGPIFKTLTLGDLFATGQRCYPRVLNEQGPL
ncbi:MAG: SCP2 sterol-binding domain-containing protein [Anaerolineae bacterium]